PVLHYTERPSALVQAIGIGDGSPVALTEDGRFQRGQTMVGRLSPVAHIVEHTIGTDCQMNVTTPRQPLRRGDLILSGSDGFFENFGSYDVIVQILHAHGASSAVQSQGVLMEEAMLRQALLSGTRRQTESQALNHDYYLAAYRRSHGGAEPPPDW